MIEVAALIILALIALRTFLFRLVPAVVDVALALMGEYRLPGGYKTEPRSAAFILMFSVVLWAAIIIFIIGVGVEIIL